MNDEKNFRKNIKQSSYLQNKSNLHYEIKV